MLKRIVNYSLLLVVALAGLAGWPASLAAQTGGDPEIEMPGSVSRALGQAVAPGQLPAQPDRAEWQVSVVLKPRNSAQLEALARDLKNPASPAFGRFIDAAEFERRFAPAPAVADHLKQHFLARGLRLVYQSNHRLVQTYQGTAAQLDRAFGTRSEYRQNARGERGLINVTPVKLPASIAGSIKGVSGLDRLNVNKSLSRPPSALPGAPYLGQQTYYSMRIAYNIPNNITGLNTTIGITLWTPPEPADLARWITAWNLPNLALTIIPLSPANELPDPAGVYEANMDVQMAHTAAPDARINFYVGANSDMLPAIARAIDDEVDAITNSWGACEPDYPGDYLMATNSLLMSATALGIPVFFSSGDSGVYLCGLNQAGHAAYPAADPEVTAVGGTTLINDYPTAVWLNEVGWSCPGPTDQSCQQEQGGSSGGGISYFFDRPAYQTVGPAIPPGFNYSPPTSKRVLPDLSMDADGRSGQIIYFKGTIGNIVCNDSCPGGGTSASAPLMAGIAALATQRAGHKIGSFNPYIYASAPYATWLYDVTAGYNGAYAGAGWDYITGLGSLRDANAFLWYFLSAPSGLKALAVSGSQINLSWLDTNNNEGGFTIERKTGPAGNWEIIAAVPPNTGGFASSGLVADTQYFYRVRAYNLYGYSGYSNESSAITAAELIVSLNQDRGEALDGNTAGTLSYAIKRAAGKTVTFDAGLANIAVSGKLPAVPPAAIIYGRCSASGPTITIHGQSAPSGTPGLQLPAGPTALYGLKIMNFPGLQLKFNAAKSLTYCVVITK